jgi:hypothetical protein
MKNLFIIFILMFPFILFSQDTIYKHRGKPVICKINSITDGNIYYVKAGKTKEKSIAESKVKRHTYGQTEYKVAEKHDVVYRDEMIVFSHQFSLPSVSQEDIYQRFKQYVSEKDEKLRKSIKKQYPENSKLYAHVTMSSHYETFFGEEPSTVQYSMIFLADGSKVTIEITDVYINSKDASNSLETWHAHPGHFFRSQIDVLIIEFDEILKAAEMKIKSY